MQFGAQCAVEKWEKDHIISTCVPWPAPPAAWHGMACNLHQQLQSWHDDDDDDDDDVDDVDVVASPEHTKTILIHIVPSFMYYHSLRVGI